MQNFGAKGGHFRRFLETDFVDALGLRHDARIGGIDAGHIGPYIDASRLQCFSQQCRGIVATAAAEGGSAPFCLTADKALGDDQLAFQARQQQGARLRLEHMAVRLGSAKLIVGAHHFTYIKPRRRYAALP